MDHNFPKPDKTNESKNPSEPILKKVNLHALRPHPGLYLDRAKISLILSFLIPIFIMLVLFAMKRIYPFGRRSFLYSDMYHQYVPFFYEFVNKIKSGEGLSYSFQIGLGSNFLALYIYYLASPLNWLAFLLPQKYIIEFMSYMVIVRLGLCGLTSCIYLRRRFHTNDFAILFFSCFYALSGFTAAYNYNVIWLDCVVLLPLILLGLERLVKEQKYGLYCITLALSILTNFYLSILICIFLVLYFIVLMCTEKANLKAVGAFMLYSLLAGGMAAVFLIPEAYALSSGDFSKMAFPESSLSYFSILEVLARHCINVIPERMNDHWPNIYCGVAIFLLLPMYSLNHRIPMRRRFSYLALASFMLVSFSSNILDFIWHGMNFPDGLPARQSFIYILLLLVMGYEAFRGLQATDRRIILYCYLAAAVLLLGFELFYKQVESDYITSGAIMLTLVFITLYAVLLYLYRTREGRRWRFGLALVTLIVVMTETGMNTYHTSIETTSRSHYTNPLEDLKILSQQASSLEAAKGTDETGQSFYRIENFTLRSWNDGPLAGYPSASLFSSTLNSRVPKLYRKLGMSSTRVFYHYAGATPLISALFNVHYMFAEDDSYNSSLYQLAGSSGNIYLYENTAFLPFGYVAPTGYDIPKSFTTDGIQLQNRMVNELGVEGDLFQRVTATQEEEDFILLADQPGYYYMELLTPESTYLTATGSFGTKKYDIIMPNGSINLGYLETGETVRLSKTIYDDDETDEAEPNILLGAWRMDEDILSQALSVLSQNSLKHVTYDTTHITGEINMDCEGRLILSIPYENGWKIQVDDHKVKPDLFGDTFIALELSAGQHRIALEYTPPGQIPGLIISVASIVIFILILFLTRRSGRSSTPTIPASC